MHNNSSHQPFSVDNPILIRHHPPSHGQNAPKHPNIKQDGPPGGDLKMKERVGIDEGEQDEHARERSGEEGDEAGEERRLRFGELADVLVRKGASFVQALLEEVGQFVVFAEFPARVLRELA